MAKYKFFWKGGDVDVAHGNSPRAALASIHKLIDGESVWGRLDRYEIVPEQLPFIDFGEQSDDEVD